MLLQDLVLRTGQRLEIPCKFTSGNAGGRYDILCADTSTSYPGRVLARRSTAYLIREEAVTLEILKK